jgi:hypothetical protein
VLGGDGGPLRLDRPDGQGGNPVELPGDRDRTTVIGAFAQLYLPHKSSLVAAMPSLGGTDHPVGRSVRPACQPVGRSWPTPPHHQAAASMPPLDRRDHHARSIVIAARCRLDAAAAMARHGSLPLPVAASVLPPPRTPPTPLRWRHESARLARERLQKIPKIFPSAISWHETSHQPAERGGFRDGLAAHPCRLFSVT